MWQTFAAILWFCAILLLCAAANVQEEEEHRRRAAEQKRAQKRRENLQAAISYRAMLNKEQMLREREKWEV